MVPFKGLFAPISRSWMSKVFRDSESLGKSNGKKCSQIWKLLLIKGVKSPRNFFFVRGEFCKDQETIQQGSRGYTTRIRRLYNKIRRLYNKDQEVISRIFWYRCYYLHLSRDALSPIFGIFCDYASEYSHNLFVLEQKQSQKSPYSWEVDRQIFTSHHMERLIGRSAYLILEGQICLLLC